MFLAADTKDFTFIWVKYAPVRILFHGLASLAKISGLQNRTSTSYCFKIVYDYSGSHPLVQPLFATRNSTFSLEEGKCITYLQKR
jgi:hypothetical protein